MPRKVKTSASIARNRVSQRRSRARHRELLDEMRRKIHEYESRGVEASLEMQHAARAVAKENHRLRLMLARRSVLPEEIQAFLDLSDEALQHMAVDETTRPSNAGPPLELPPACQKLERHDECVHTVQVPFESYPNESLVSRTQVRTAVTEMQSSQQSCFDDANNHAQTQQNTMPASPVPESSRTSLAATLQTSCIEAAGIIAGLYGHQDTAQTLIRLGCSGNSDCVVKTEAVFQLIDDAV